MNALQLAQSAYAANSAPIRTPRGTEYEAFARITSRLKALDPKRDNAAFVAALHDNRQLWTILAIDVADPANELPQALRAQIFYLAEFTDVHTSRVLAGRADVSALIDINTAVMRGLRGNGAAG